MGAQHLARSVRIIRECPFRFPGSRSVVYGNDFSDRHAPMLYTCFLLEGDTRLYDSWESVKEEPFEGEGGGFTDAVRSSTGKKHLFVEVDGGSCRSCLIVARVRYVTVEVNGEVEQPDV